MAHKIYLTLITLLLSVSALAQDSIPTTSDGSSTQTKGTLQDAMTAYSDARYVDASSIFEQAIATATNPTDELYYNLGAAYYKQGSYAKALLNFQRAYRLNPSDSDIRHNINVTRTKTLDQMEPKGTFFLHDWIDQMTHWFGLQGWMMTGGLFFTIMVVGVLLYLLSRNRSLRLLGFYGALAALLLCIWANVMLSQSYKFVHDTKQAVITDEVVTVKSSPDMSSEDVMVVHSGMEVKVIEKVGTLTNVEFPDGSQGWISNGAYELVNNFKNLQ